MLNETLLEKAHVAATRLSEAETTAQLARADYHAMIRRLHLGGGSLREIAQALGVSHQRIQQIVDEAGGSWWKRWRSRTVKRDAVCTFCARPPSEVSKLIAGPNVFICDACVSRAERAVDGEPIGGLELANVRSTRRCSFCSKRSEFAALVLSTSANVCGDCLELCRAILGGGRAAPE